MSVSNPASNAIDLMEKEQEGVVLKLMHEITCLKEENKRLKHLLHIANGGTSTGSSTSSGSSSAISSNHSSFSLSVPRSSMTSCVSPMLSPTTPSSDSPFNNYYFGSHRRSPSASSSISTVSTTPSPMSQRRNTITTMTNMKRVPISPSIPLTVPSAIPGPLSTTKAPRSQSRSRSNSFTHQVSKFSVPVAPKSSDSGSTPKLDFHTNMFQDSTLERERAVLHKRSVSDVAHQQQHQLQHHNHHHHRDSIHTSPNEISEISTGLQIRK